MGNTEAVYHRIEQETFEDVEMMKNRNFDCVLVFDIGSAEKDWRVPADGSEIQYDYLKLLDQDQLETRKKQFPQHGADFSSSRTKEKDFYKFERRLVIDALTKMEVKCIHITAMTRKFEKDKNLMFFYVGIKERTARRFAHKIEYELELDPQSAISYLELMDEPLAIATVSDEEDCKQCGESHWKNIFIKFDNNVAPEIYKPFDVLDQGDQKDGYEDSLFRIRDRLALINEIVTQDVELGGCGIFVPQLAAKDHCIVDFYPLHTIEHLEYILHRLFSWRALTVGVLSLPLEEIRCYFGEYIGIYFAYLQFMTWYFVPLAILGFALQALQWIEGVVLVEGIQYFALLVILWSVCFPILWRRREFGIALKWGTLRFDFKERPRPEFYGEYRKSNIHGGLEEYFPYTIRNTRRMITFAVVCSFLIALFGSVVAVVLLRVYVSNTGIDYGTYFISIANALVIMFFNNIYGIFAEKLNSWENYKTETEYENNLIIKIFIFRFINSYATLYYIAFFRRYESSDSSLYCDAEDCMEDLAAQLGTIFITQLTVSNALELGSLAMSRMAKGVITSYFTEEEKDSVWAQYSSQVYERTFDDYCEILVSFGYATLFVIAFPLAPFAAFAGCVVEARIDGYKLCKLTRRPFPRQADDVGTWQLAMEVMGWAVLVTNLMIICFAAEDLDFTFLGLSDTTFQETLTALILFAALCLCVAILNWCIAKTPQNIKIHMARQDHLESRIKDIGGDIERYLNSLNLKQLQEWKEWSSADVTRFLQQIMYKNPIEYDIIRSSIRHSKFTGQDFFLADEHLLEKKLSITDHLHKRFVLNARRVLQHQLEEAQKQDAALFESEESTRVRRRVEEEEQGGTAPETKTKQFEFTMEHFERMAQFFEEDLTGQSKRKLWSKVDKDKSKAIEENEMENFLYFSIVVYIKAKHKNVTLPKKSNRKFRQNILKPLEKWLLHHKISFNGLTFDEFNRFFPKWLRQYKRENMGQSGGDKRFSKGTAALAKSTSIDMMQPPTQSVVGGTMRKLGKMFGSKDKGDKDRQAAPIISSMLSIGSNRDEDDEIGPMQGVYFAPIDRSQWSKECIDWEKKLESVANAIDKTDVSTRSKIWDKFDRKKVERLDCEKSLSRLVYSLIALYIKTKNRDAKPPKFNLLQPLLLSICDDIRRIINHQNNDLEDTNNYISKHEFQTYIAVYIRKIAIRRKEELKHSLKLSSGGTKRSKKRRT